MMHKQTQYIYENSIEILETYQEKNLKLTLRQLYYQLVAQNIISNTLNSYKNLSRILTMARKKGWVPYDCLEDRTREIESLPYWDNHKSGIESLHSQFKLNLWETQPEEALVLIEKDALSGVIQPVCDKYRVPYLACKGYLSVSAIANIKTRLNDKSITLFYFGDHDPSGLDMVDYLRKEMMPSGFEVVHIALTTPMTTDLPANPAKETDTRFKAYAEKYGNKSWELDALKPELIQELLENNILELIDKTAWAEAKEKEKAEKQALLELYS